ncbi:substrate-binding periplasmic protein [Paracoccus sp. P2]|uniref:substrate-binding periplasmic protein n=1 Tax=Paracoccus sp. P2 TaxID=3248840 RepID=UPI00391F2B10
MLMKKISKPATMMALAVALSAGAAPAQETSGYWQKVQDAGKLRCGAAIAAPYLMRDPATGEYSGFFADICRDFAAVLSVQPEFVDTTWDNIVAGLQAGKWDVSLALSRTPTRAMAINFSDAAMEYKTSFIYRNDNPKFDDNPTSFADIDVAGNTFVVMSGSSQDKTVTDATKNATIVRLPGHDEARLAIMSRRADVLVDASDANAIYVEMNPDWAVLFNPEPPLAEYGVGFGLPQSLTYQEVQVANIFIEQLRATGKVEEYIAKAVAEVAAAGKN